MSAPTATARGTPTGLPLTDGHPTFVTLARFPTISFWEKEVQPFGEDGGDPVDITTFFNANRRTYAPRQLMAGTEMTIVAAYDPAVLGTLRQAVNVRDVATVTHPDGTTEARHATVTKVTPQNNTEGEQPTIEVVVFPLDADDDNVEREPVIVSVTGT